MLERKAEIRAKYRDSSFHSIVIMEKWNRYIIKIHLYCNKKNGKVLQSTANDIVVESRKTKCKAIQAACEIITMESSNDSIAAIRKRLTVQKQEV